MGLFDIFKRKVTAPATINNYSGFGAPPVSGTVVNENRIMGLAAHFACVRLIATTLASLPVHVYERAAGGKKNRLFWKYSGKREKVLKFWYGNNRFNKPIIQGHNRGIHSVGDYVSGKG